MSGSEQVFLASARRAEFQIFSGSPQIVTDCPVNLTFLAVPYPTGGMHSTHVQQIVQVLLKFS